VRRCAVGSADETGFRYKHPAGLLSLGSFTAFEAFAVGAAVSFYDQQIVLQALLITCVRPERK